MSTWNVVTEENRQEVIKKLMERCSITKEYVLPDVDGNVKLEGFVVSIKTDSGETKKLLFQLQSPLNKTKPTEVKKDV